MPTGDAGLWNLFTQIPLVGVFVWFVLRTNKDNAASRAAEAAADRVARAAEAEADRVSREKEAAQNRQLWQLLREEISSSTRQIRYMTSLLIEHDRTVRGKNESVQGTTEDMLERARRNVETLSPPKAKEEDQDH